MCIINYNHWCTVPEKWSAMDKIFCLFGPFLPFYPPDNPKNQNFEKTKATPGDIILHICIINDNHMMYDFWDTKFNRQNFLSFWTIFCIFTHLTTQKTKIFKRNTWRNYYFTHVYHKWQPCEYDVWFLGYGAKQAEFFVILGHF